MARVSGCKGVVCRGANALGYLRSAKKKGAKKRGQCYNIGVERNERKQARSKKNKDFFRSEGVLDMTAVFVFAALIVVNAVYCIYDGRSEEAARQMDDFYRVEFKKNYGAREDALTQSWY